jgi:hypothetical protein
MTTHNYGNASSKVLCRDAIWKTASRLRLTRSDRLVHPWIELCGSNTSTPDFLLDKLPESGALGFIGVDNHSAKVDQCRDRYKDRTHLQWEVGDFGEVVSNLEVQPSIVWLDHVSEMSTILNRDLSLGTTLTEGLKKWSESYLDGVLAVTWSLGRILKEEEEDTRMKEDVDRLVGALERRLNSRVTCYDMHGGNGYGLAYRNSHVGHGGSPMGFQIVSLRHKL